MSYSQVENVPITVNLITAANDTSWVNDGVNAQHSSCNSGSETLLIYALLSGHIYSISWAVLSISGGYVQLQSPGSNGAQQTAPGLYVETLSPTSNGSLNVYSNANCQITAVYIQDITMPVGQTLAYNAKDKVWVDNRTFYPDYGWSLYEDMITAYQGRFWLHENGGNDRNTFYGTVFPSIIQYVMNASPAIVKTFQSLSIQSNQLMVTGNNGISTSLGQVSALAEIDFIKDFLSDSNSSVEVETIEGVLSANFLRDLNTGDIENGDVLRGNYLVITLQTIASNQPLRLYSINIVSRHSLIGSR